MKQFRLGTLISDYVFSYKGSITRSSDNPVYFPSVIPAERIICNLKYPGALSAYACRLYEKL